MWRRLIMIGLNILLAAVISWLWTTEVPDPAPASSGKRTLAPDASQPHPISSTMPPTVGRPLFRPSTEPAGSSPAPEQMPQPELRLVGVVVGDRRVGLIERNGPKAQRVSEGDQIAGWTVRAIEARTLTLSRGDRIAVYHLDPPRSR